MVNVLIGGDICPIGINMEYFRNGESKNIFNDLLPYFQQSDLSIVNLESPLIEQSSPIAKAGPTIGVPSECINGIKNSGIDVVNMANNHILDHGPQGLINTLNVCDRNGIATVGAGKNLEFARKILIRDVRGIKIGILGVSEHEFSIATKNSYGANPLDLIDYVRNINSNSHNFDYLIVLFHGGNEHYPFPSPRIKDTCQFMVEMGANAIIMQHSHCPGCFQEYKGSLIVYGQGNLIFDSANRERAFYEGFLVGLSINHDLSSKMRIMPYVQSISQHGARKMDENTELDFRYGFEKRSRSILNDAFVRDRWIEFCREKSNNYLNRLLIHSRLFEMLNKYLDLVKAFRSNSFLYRLQNLISCESHREVIETILNHRLYK